MEGIEARLLATEDTGLDLEVREIDQKGRGVVVSISSNIIKIILTFKTMNK